MSTAVSHPASSYITGSSSTFFNPVTPVLAWSEGDVKGWLQSVGFNELAHVSEEQGIDGNVLIHLDSESLRDLGFVKVGQRLRLLKLISELMGFPDELDLPPNAKLIDDQTSIEYNIWNALHYQSDKIRTLEDQIWKLKEVTKFLRERTDSLSSFNTVTLSSSPFK